MKLLIVYGTTEGHTRKIAECVGDWVNGRGHEVTLMDSSKPRAGLDLEGFDAYVIAGSIHMDKHQASLGHFVQENLERIQSKPSAFLSVSMTAALDDENQSAARQSMTAFTDQANWTPTVSTPVAGALLFTKYDFFKRLLLKMISKKQGGPTDTSQDYEFTNWVALKEFIMDFLAKHVEEGQVSVDQAELILKNLRN